MCDSQPSKSRIQIRTNQQTFTFSSPGQPKDVIQRRTYHISLTIATGYRTFPLPGQTQFPQYIAVLASQEILGKNLNYVDAVLIAISIIKQARMLVFSPKEVLYILENHMLTHSHIVS